MKSPFHRQLDHFAADGPQPRRSCSPHLATRCYCDFGQGNSTSGPTQSQEANTTDSRVGVEGDGAVIVRDATLGNITLNSLDGAVAQSAIDAAVDLARVGSGTVEDALVTARDLGADALDTTRQLNQTSADTLTDLASRALSGFGSLVAANQTTTGAALKGAGEVSASALSSASTALSQASANAALVANSQSQFLSTQTGQGTVQKVIGYTLAGATVIALGLALANRKSK